MNVVKHFRRFAISSTRPTSNLLTFRFTVVTSCLYRTCRSEPRNQRNLTARDWQAYNAVRLCFSTGLQRSRYARRVTTWTIRVYVEISLRPAATVRGRQHGNVSRSLRLGMLCHAPVAPFPARSRSRRLLPRSSQHGGELPDRAGRSSRRRVSSVFVDHELSRGTARGTMAAGRVRTDAVAVAMPSARRASAALQVDG